MVYYHPQQSCEGYVFTGLCLSTGGFLVPGGLLLGGLVGGVWSGGVWSQGMCLVLGGSAPRGVSCLGLGLSATEGIPACTEADPPGETATAADGTHPTRMHSCSRMRLAVYHTA